jgi:hypothetical protein
MEQNPLPPAKKISDFPMTQPINKDVMELVANKGKPKNPPNVEKSKAQIQQLMAQGNIRPEQLVRAGQMAMMAIQDKSTYPMLVQMAVQEGLIQPNELPPTPDYKMLAGLVSAGKIAQMIVDQSK